MDPAPQQHPKSHGYGSAADIGRKTSCTHTAATVFTRPHTVTFGSPWAKNGASGSMFSNSQRHKVHCNSSTACHTKGGLL